MYSVKLPSIGLLALAGIFSSLALAQPPSFSNSDQAAFKHDTFDTFYRSLEGAVPESTPVILRFRTAHFAVDGVTLRAYLLDTGSGSTTGPVDTPMVFDQNITEGGTTYDAWKTSVTMPAKPTIFYYKFLAFRGNVNAFYSDDYIDGYDNLNKGGTGSVYAAEPLDSFQITVYDPQFQTPAWLQKANVYQIFPDRFRNGDPSNDYCAANSTSGCPSLYGAPGSGTIAVTPWNTLICDPRASGPCSGDFGNVFYGGDLSGIEQKLGYLESIGFDTLYMTPIFLASSNHRYDTDDYLNVDPALGGNAAFASLAAAAKRRHMHLILDAVFNHASSDSVYFNRYSRFNSPGACQSLTSQYRSWFEFLDTTVPCGDSDYNAWFGTLTLPVIDHTQKAVQDFFYSGAGNVMRNWYQAGASGWRFDVAGDPNFAHSWWVATRQFAKGYLSDGPLIGEIWPDASPWLAGDQLDSVMNYRFRRNVLGFARGAYNWIDDNDNGNDAIVPLTPSQFDRANRALRDDYPPQATAAMLNLIDSHDTNRALYVLTELGDNGLQQGKQRLLLAAIFQFTYTGAPMVFYGDEAGINAPSRNNGPNGPIGDPYARAPYPWSDQPGDPTIYGPADTALIAVYTKLARFRKKHPALTGGQFITLLTGDTQSPSTASGTYAYARTLGTDTVVVALNNGSQDNNPVIPTGTLYPDGAQLSDAISGASYSVSGGQVSLLLPARAGVILSPSSILKQ